MSLATKFLPRLRRWGACRTNRLVVAAVVAFLLTLGAQAALAGEQEQAASAPKLPNFVVVFADDLGYADLSCFGAKKIKTPHLDRMAAEGMRFTDFHVAAAVCGASRAALLTGCYPQRLGILGAPGPSAQNGISDDETLIPELLQTRGYRSAIFGKWHLGHHRRFLPLQHGFSEYFGLPYSNDMWPYHPTNGKNYPKLPLIEGNEAIEYNPDQNQLTTRYTERAVKFIEQHREQPFFLYVPHAMPHAPLHVSSKFRGKSDQGLYGDVIMEIDWSVGQILDALKRTGLDERTLVLFTSDNGPWLSYGNHAGSADVLREGKGTTWEGGQRVPCIARWPGRVPAGKVCDELCSTLDLLPTFASLAGVEIPNYLPKQVQQPEASGAAQEAESQPQPAAVLNFAVDGHDITPLLTGQPGAKSPYEAFYYYWQRGLEAVRAGEWKLHFPHSYRSLTGTPGRDGRPGGYSEGHTPKVLYNLAKDPGEQHNVLAEHPEVVARLEQLAELARADIGDTLTQRQGTGVRQPGRIATAPQ